MDTLNKRFFDNHLLEFLLKEREAGHIRHLGFSYHGDVRPFDWLLDHQDEYHFDFVQIQMNFLDWRHASMGNGWRKDADAEYLYNKCEKTGVQCVIMEPLRGGAFGKMAQELTDQLKAVRPNDSTARWAFRWVGSHPNILTTLSGMNQMDHMKENVETFSPLENCTEAENTLLAEIADQMAGFPTMKQAADYASKKLLFADGLRNALPNVETWARSCADCEECLAKCPQQIRIPNQMARIVELLRNR